MPDPDIDIRQDNGQDHHREGNLHKADEGNLLAMLCSQRSHNNVSGSTDQGTIAAQAGAQCQTPPHGFEVAKAHLPHILNQRNQGSDKGNVIDERGSNRTHPKNQHGRHRDITIGHSQSLCCHRLDDACLHQSTNQHEQTSKEEKQKLLISVLYMVSLTGV